MRRTASSGLVSRDRMRDMFQLRLSVESLSATNICKPIVTIRQLPATTSKPKIARVKSTTRRDRSKASPETNLSH